MITRVRSNILKFKLQQIFEEADDDDEPGLDMGEFRVAMRRAMGPHLSDEELDAMFMKVRISLAFNLI